MSSEDIDADEILMNELRRKDERLTVEMFNAISDPNEMQSTMLKKLQLYYETEAVLKESRNKLILGFMKVAIENRMMITQIKSDLDLRVGDLAKRVQQLEEEKERQDK